MGKSKTILTLKQQKIVAVIRGNNLIQAIKTASACISGGIKAIEIAYTNSEASQAIKNLRQTYQDDTSVLIGAGTVLDAQTAREAIFQGAQYIVSPSFHQETARICNLYNIPYLPGCFTLTEITTALEAGSEIVKLFPGSNMEPSYIKAIKAPLPHACLMVTGGVSLKNAQTWLTEQVDAIGIGGEFNRLAQEERYTDITQLAHQYVKIVHAHSSVLP